MALGKGGPPYGFARCGGQGWLGQAGLTLFIHPCSEPAEQGLPGMALSTVLLGMLGW